MLNYLNGNKKNFEKKLNIILDKRKSIQSKKLDDVRSIIKNVKNNKDKALIKYEKKFSLIKSKIGVKSIKFSKKEIEKISKKIRDAELKKIPYMIIIGENELKSNKISLRKHTEGDLGKMTLDDLISILKKEKNVIINN